MILYSLLHTYTIVIIIKVNKCNSIQFKLIQIRHIYYIIETSKDLVFI